MPTNPSALPTIPPFPALSDRAAGTYNSKAFTWATEWDTIVAPALETLAETTYDNAVEAAASSTLAVQNTGTAIGFTFDVTTTDADPGAGKLRLNNATQNTATVIRADNTSAAGSDVAALLATFGNGTSAVKGRLRIQKATDATKWLIFDVTAVASPSGYKNITASCTASSAASPFADGDALAVSFVATGDKGDTGATGAAGTFGGTATSTAEFLTGTTIASASTVNLNTATGNRVHITGTTTITAWTLTRGPRTVIFDGACQLTYNATTNRLNSGGANVTVEAGDMAYIESDGTTVYVNVIKKSGAAVVAASSGLVLLSTVTAANSATVDIETTFNSTYSDYLLVVSGVTVQNNNDAILMRMKIGGSYLSTATYQYHAPYMSVGGTGYQAAASSSATSIQIAVTVGSSALSSCNFHMRIRRPDSTAFIKIVDWYGASNPDTAAAIQMTSGVGANTGTAALTGLRFLASTGNILAGTFRLYGLANS